MIDGTDLVLLRARARQMAGCVLRGTVLLGGFLALSPAAVADVLRLHNGNILEGRVGILADGSYQVATDEGASVTVPADQVVEHIVKEPPLDELARRLAGTGDGDWDGLIELAAWGENKNLRRAVLPIYRRILALDPHHDIARDRLGYVTHRNRWVSRNELMKKGFVRVAGVWVTAEEAEARREQAAIRDFEALLSDAEHENLYLRENALNELFKNRDPLLVPYLERALAMENPLRRMIAATILGNHPWAETGERIYQALREEARPEVQHAMIAVFYRFARDPIGDWMRRDLEGAAADPPVHDALAIRNLLDLFEVCPHRDAVPGLIALLAHPSWKERAQESLLEFVNPEPRTPEAWRLWWERNQAGLSRDLGHGWLEDR